MIGRSILHRFWPKFVTKERRRKRPPIEIRAHDVAIYWMAVINRISAESYGSQDIAKLSAAKVRCQRILRHMHRIREVQTRAAMRS